MASLVATGSLQEFPESGLISSKWAAAAAGTRTPRAARPARRGERVTAGGGGWCQLELERLELTDAYVSPPVVLSALTWCWASSLNGGISFRSKDVQIDGRCVVSLRLISSQWMTPLRSTTRSLSVEPKNTSLISYQVWHLPSGRSNHSSQLGLIMVKFLTTFSCLVSSNTYLYQH